ncbi:uncharacterized protein LOC111790093 isoform X2 [Cucurbita pepo subsp. pepo]|uniref:uncharacterized protein LOC111790093 isoform X2 n=1 Tax=Cucurbita pepo subsp. pepo TaxID=3664 RepID=UPI000C9D2709|nr:uncharacterized protein LOC111790093 isoform X2 [Cucurbita pepo subsp. pepo]
MRSCKFTIFSLSLSLSSTNCKSKGNKFSSPLPLPFYQLFCVWSYISEHRGRLVLLNMVLESILSSPHRRHPPFRKQFPANELGSWSTLFNRHRFLLTALALLTLLCTIYLYFAITLGAAVSSCSGLTGAQKELCRLEHAEASLGKGKFKFL